MLSLWYQHTNRLTVNIRPMTPAKSRPWNHWLKIVSWTMTTLPLPIPYSILPITMMDILLPWIDNDTSTLPIVMRTVVMMDPLAVPKASKKTPPSTGKMVLTIETLDWSTPYSELVIPNSSLMMFFIAPSVCAAKWLPTSIHHRGKDCKVSTMHNHIHCLSLYTCQE